MKRIGLVGVFFTVFLFFFVMFWCCWSGEEFFRFKILITVMDVRWSVGKKTQSIENKKYKRISL